MKNEKIQLKLKKFFISFWPVLFIILLWFMFSSPYFLKGLVPYSSTYQVNHFPPWTAYEKNWGPVKNGAMPDVTDQIYPWRHFTVQTFLSGQIPFWNPNNFAGNPHLANFQSAVFSPFNILFLILPFVDAWSLNVLLQPLLAGLGMYLFMRSLKVEKVGAVLSSVTFMFCGFIVVWMAYGTLSMAIALLPLTLFAIEEAFHRFSLRWGILINFCIATSFFSGHFQTSLYLFLLSVSYFIFKFLQEREKRKSFSILAFILLGLCISMLQILPSIQLYFHAVRSEIFILSGGIPLQYLVTFIAPDFFGNPVTRNDWFGQYAEWASFIGIVPFTIALFSLRIWKNKTVFFFWIVAILSILLAIHSPILNFLGFLRIPVLSTSTPSRIIVLSSFSFAVLSGFGFYSLYQLLEKRNVKKILPVFLAVGGLLVLIWILLLFFNIFPTDKLVIAKRNTLLPSLLFFIFGGITVLSLILKNKKVFYVLPIIILLVACFDSLRFAQKWMPFDPKQLVYPDVPVIAAMKKHIGYGRYFGNLGAQVATYYNLPSIEGYDPLYSKRIGEFLRAAQSGTLIEAERSVAKLDRNGKYTDRVLDLLGVSIIFHPVPDTNQSWAYPVWKNKKKHSLIYSDQKFQLYRNNTVVLRPSLYYEYEVIPDERKALERFYHDDFPFRKTVILEEDPALPVYKQDKTISGSVEVVSNTPNKIDIKVNTNKKALLFLSDTYYPGWKVKVNGMREKIYRADYTFRAVVVQEGSSDVSFYYTPL